MVAAPAAPTRTHVYFRVTGTPATKGSWRTWHSWRPGGKCLYGSAPDSGARLKEWEALVATAAKNAMGHDMPLAGPLKVSVVFRFPRPKAHKPAQRLVPWCWGNHKWDVEKTVRATFDAITDAAVWGDDSQVAVLEAEKRYCEEGEQPGAVVQIWSLS